MSNNPKLTRVLTIDGGGIRGILPAQILASLEQKLQKKSGNHQARLAEYFDLIAGTSTGGILTCIYLVPDKVDNTKPYYKASDAIDLYLKNGGQIFYTPVFKRLRTLGGTFDEKYPSENIDEVLKQYFGDLELKQLIKPCLIPAYDVFDSKAHFFTQHDARLSEGRNYLVREVARATSAAPSYFEAAKVTSMSGVTYPLIDGGVFANNPSLCAYAEARQMDFDENKCKPTADDIFMVSIGTGNTTKKKLKYETIKNYGVLEWIKPLIDIMMSGVSQTVDFQLKQLFAAAEKPFQYIRIEPILHHAKAEMDDASPKNLAALKEAGTKSAEDERTDKLLDLVADMLIKNA